MKKYIKPEIRQIDLELNCVLNNGSNNRRASTESVRWGGDSFTFSDTDEEPEEEY